MKSFLDTALAAAEAAAAEILRFYRGEFEVELKSAQTPVTIADRRAEEIIRGHLLGAFPDHGFLWCYLQSGSFTIKRDPVRRPKCQVFS